MHKRGGKQKITEQNKKKIKWGKGMKGREKSMTKRTNETNRENDAEGVQERRITRKKHRKTKTEQVRSKRHAEAQRYRDMGCGEYTRNEFTKEESKTNRERSRHRGMKQWKSEKNK